MDFVNITLSGFQAGCISKLGISEEGPGKVTNLPTLDKLRRNMVVWVGWCVKWVRPSSGHLYEFTFTACLSECRGKLQNWDFFGQLDITGYVLVLGIKPQYISDRILIPSDQVKYIKWCACSWFLHTLALKTYRYIKNLPNYIEWQLLPWIFSPAAASSYN